MESILAILCIVFLSVLTYGFIQGSSMNTYYSHNCRTLYIPENIDLETAFQSVNHMDRKGLTKRARDLGASKSNVENQSNIDLKVFIIQNSISDEHILFDDIRYTLKDHELIQKREYCRDNIRNQNLPKSPDINKSCPTIPKPTLGDYNKVIIPTPNTMVYKEHRLLADPSISIQQMRQDIEDYLENKI